MLTAVALLAGGMTVGRLTGRPLLRSGLRQLALGAVEVTFAVGASSGGRLLASLRRLPPGIREPR